MSTFMVVLRLIHILFGIFWVGTAFFFVLYLTPTIKAAGPAGGSVMGRLTLMRFPMVMSLSSLLTVAAGVVIYLIDSGGLQISWLSSASGITMTIGSIAGILAFVLGLVIQTPAGARMAALQKKIQVAGGPPTPSQTEELQALLDRIAQASRWGAVLMVIAVIGMAMAREL